LHVLKTGCRWRDVPDAYGPPTTVCNRFNRWARRGVWLRIFTAVAASGEVPAERNLDSTHVKAHRAAVVGKGGSTHASIARRSSARAVATRTKSIVWPMPAADRLRSP